MTAPHEPAPRRSTLRRWFDRLLLVMLMFMAAIATALLGSAAIELAISVF